MIELTGLRINNAQAVFAAYGLTRVLSERGLSVRLEWRVSDHRAVLSGCDWETLKAHLAEHLKGREQAVELNWADAIKEFPRERYRELMQSSDAKTRKWLEAYWHEPLTHPRSGQKRELALAQTRLDMTAGRVKLFSGIRKTILELQKKDLDAELTKTLLQAWINTDECFNPGWDWGAVKAGASISGGKPPDKTPARGVMAAVWLAFEALPWFPSRWLTHKKSANEVSWVIPHLAVSAAGIESMLLAQQGLSVSELHAQNWSHWVACIAKNGEYGYLLPAARTLSTTQNTASPQAGARSVL